MLEEVFHPDTLEEIIRWIPKIVALTCTNKWLYTRLRGHPEITFWRDYKSPADIYARGPPKFLELIDDLPVFKLINAVNKGNLTLVRYLCETGPTPGWFDWPLRGVAENGDIVMLQYFISIGADPRARDDYLLHCAAMCGQTKMVRYLVEIGADPRSRNGYACRCAAENGHTETVRYLASVGADPPRAR